MPQASVLMRRSVLGLVRRRFAPSLPALLGRLRAVWRRLARRTGPSGPSGRSGRMGQVARATPAAAAPQALASRAAADFADTRPCCRFF